jgi:two-component system chemotaxis sensor kinase CheA
MIDDRPLLNEYLSESEELLDALLADLDLLEPSASDPDPNLVNRVFRTVHSLKGLFAMMGLDRVQSLAHQFEDLLDRLRLGKLRLTAGAAVALQEAGAGLAALVAVAARGSAAEQDYTRLQELLSSIAARRQRSGKGVPPDLASIGLSARERGLLNEFEVHRLRENLSAGRPLYSISIQFTTTGFEAQFGALATRLAGMGEMITALPGESDRKDVVALKLLLAGHAREAELRRLVEPHQGKVTRLGTSTWRRAQAALIGVGRRQRPLTRKPEVEGPEELNALLPPSFAQESLHPLSPSVRVELSQIDDVSGLVHELAIESQKLSSMAREFLGAAGLGARQRFDLRLSKRRMERAFLELEERLVELRMVSLAQTFTRAARLGARLARELGKSVSVELKGRSTQLDKMIADRIADPIYHLLRNAIDHGIESPDERRQLGKPEEGHIRLEARVDGTRAVITISDDGRGIDPEQVRRRALEIGAVDSGESLSEEETLRLVFRPGFSTADQVSAVSGRGVGLDAVERSIHELGGEISVGSGPGKGTRFELSVPTTLVMVSAFIVKVGGFRYAINVGQIIELLYVTPGEVLGRDGKRSILWRGMTVPLIDLRYLLGLGGARSLHPEPDDLENAAPVSLRVPVFVARAADRHVAFAVEEFEEQREIIVKSLGSLARKIKGVTGAVDLEGGDVALVLDLPSLLLFRSLRA